MYPKGIIKGYHKWTPSDCFVVSSYTPDIGPFVKQRSWRVLNLAFHGCVHITGDTALRIYKEIDMPHAMDIWQSPTLGTVIWTLTALFQTRINSKIKSSNNPGPFQGQNLSHDLDF